MVDFVSKSSYGIDDLREIMRLLRSSRGCPWDREQTHESIRRNMLEEAFEVAEAIDSNNDADLIEELGDVLLQVIFHAEIANDSGRFNFDDIVDSISKKLVRRHPHVFSNAIVKDGNDSLSVWDDVKRQEKKHETTSEAMHSVARALPALWRAEKIQEKAAKVGFDWPDYNGAVNSLHCEVKELDSAILDDISDKLHYENIKEEIGDVLFSAVNVARFFSVDPEFALTDASDKFSKRFSYIEHKAIEAGKKLSEMTLDEMDALYQLSKLEK